MPPKSDLQGIIGAGHRDQNKSRRVAEGASLCQSLAFDWRHALRANGKIGPVALPLPQGMSKMVMMRRITRMAPFAMNPRSAAFPIALCVLGAAYGQSAHAQSAINLNFDSPPQATNSFTCSCRHSRRLEFPAIPTLTVWRPTEQCRIRRACPPGRKTDCMDYKSLSDLPAGQYAYGRRIHTVVQVGGIDAAGRYRSDRFEQERANKGLCWRRAPKSCYTHKFVYRGQCSRRHRPVAGDYFLWLWAGCHWSAGT